MKKLLILFSPLYPLWICSYILHIAPPFWWGELPTIFTGFATTFGLLAYVTGVLKYE